MATVSVLQEEDKKLNKFYGLTACMGRSFKDWWAAVPEDLKTKAKGNDDWNTYKPILNELNFVWVMLNQQGKFDLVPTGEEVLGWVGNGEIDAMRQIKK